MSDDLALRAPETRIDAALFGQRYWVSPHWREVRLENVNAMSRRKDDVPVDRVEITPAEAATCGGVWGGVWGHREFATDWSLLPKLFDECVKRGWSLSIYPLPWEGGDWNVDLEFTHPYAMLDVRGGEGETLPLALCHAIVAVLDATEEIENSKAKS